MRSRFRLWILLGFLGAAVGALVLARRDVVEWFAVRGLDEAGFAPATLSVEAIGADRLVITGLSAAGGAVSVRRIEVRYAMLDLLAGRVKSVALTAPSITAVWKSGIYIGENRYPGESSSSSSLTLDTLTIEDGAAALTTPAGVVQLKLNADLARSDAAWNGALQMSGKGPGLSLSADWKGALSLVDPALSKGAGNIELGMTGFSLPGLVQKVDGRARLAARESSDGTFSVDAKADNITFASNGTWHLTPEGVAFAIAALDGKVIDFRSGTDLVSREIKASLQTGSAQTQTVTYSVGTGLKPDLALSIAPFQLYPESAKLGFSIPSIIVGGTGAEIKVRADKAVVVHDLAGIDVNSAELTWNGTDARGTATAQLVAGPDKSLTGLATRATPGLKAVANLVFDERGFSVKGDLRSAKDADVGDFSFAKLQGAAWQADINLNTMKFGANALNWSDLFAPLADLQDTTGELSLRAKLHGTAGGADGNVSLRATDLNFKLADVPFADIDAKIDVEHLAPLSGAGEHSVTFKQIGVAVPLENGVITFAFPGDNSVAINRIAASIAGGQIGGGGQTIRLDDPRPAFALHVSDIDLQRLLKAVDISGLEGQGLIGGRFPLALEQNAMQLGDGTLNSSQGIIRYKPAEIPAAISAGGPIVAQALANFHYSDLKATLNGNLMENVTIGISLRGKNPDLFNGYPVEFNLNLEGPLARIAATGLASSRIAGEVGARDIQIPVKTDGVTKPPQ